MKVKILGSGTSTGVPLVCCTCAVCVSENPRNKRLRTSAFIQTNCGQDILIDTGTDLRQQCLREGIVNVDKVLYTHCHADHVYGIDDLRPFNFKKRQPIEVFADPLTAKDLSYHFHYCFKECTNGTSVPQLNLKIFEPYEVFKIGDCEILPLPVMHGNLEVMAYRIGKFAYVTDASFIPERSKERLLDLDYLIINGLRERAHGTHFTIAGAVKEIESLKPKKSYLTHLSHEVDYDAGNNLIKSLSNLDIELAYDGLELAIS